MESARPQTSRTWTQADHDENARLIQRDADRKTWDTLGRSIGLRGRDIEGALARMFDARIAAALRTLQPPLLDQLTTPPDKDALRGAIVELISDDVVEMFHILTGQETPDERIDTEETSRSGEANATYNQRDFYQDETQEAKA